MKIESFFPGRLRISSPLFAKQANLDTVIAHVGAIDGVKETTGNTRAASLTVVYDASIITMPMLMNAKEEIERLESEMH